MNKINKVEASGDTTLQIDVNFKDARKLGSTLASFRDPPDSPQKSKEEILFGDTEIQIAPPNVNFQRTIDIRSLVPPEALNPLTKGLLGKAHIDYVIHFPTPIKTHNAHAISSDGKTLRWHVPVKDLLAGPVEMKFEAPIPRLSLYLTMIGLVLLALIFAVIFIRRRLLSNKTSS